MGKMYGIGVGPGDPELLTLKAHRLLNEADVIFCPEKAKGAGSFAFDIIKEHLKHSKAEIVNLVYPMHYHGKEMHAALRSIYRENGQAYLSRWAIRLSTAPSCTRCLIFRRQELQWR